MVAINPTVAVWMGDAGIPERFIWAGKAYVVSDTPTVLEVDYSAITHPGAMPLGWRFQGTAECSAVSGARFEKATESGEGSQRPGAEAEQSGETRIFDVLYDVGRNEWQLLHTYI